MASSANKSTDAGLHPERFGRFYLQELLNSGGMADIWFVTDGNSKPFALPLANGGNGTVTTMAVVSY